MVLTFGEPVSPLAFRLLRPNGQIDRLAHPTADGAKVRVALPPDLGSGTAIVSWRVTSSDGHPVGGAVTFVVGHETRPSGTLEWKTYHLATWLAWLVTTVSLIGAVGVAACRALVFAARSRTDVLAGKGLAVIGLVSLPIGLLTNAMELAGVDAGELRIADVGTAFFGAFALFAILCVVAFCAALGSLRLSSPSWRRTLLAVTALCAAASAFAVSGHASVAQPLLLMRPAILIHALAFLFWLGCLYPLLNALRAPVDARIAVDGLSIPLVGAALALPLTGAVMAFVQLGAVHELWSSAYGVVLLIKIAVVTPMYGLAAINRFVLTRGLRAERAWAIGWMKRTIGGELFLACSALAVVGLWHFTPPPRSMEAVTVTVSGLRFHAHGVTAMANLSLRPARVGENQFTTNLMGLDTSPLDAKAVTIAAFAPTGDLEPLRFEAHRLSRTTWVTDRVRLAQAGQWQIRIDIYISDFDRISLKTGVSIR